MTWVALDVSLISCPVWGELWASRLFVWLLCQAKVSSTPGIVRFSYPVAGRQLASTDGRKLRQPSRKTLRTALKKLCSIGLVKVGEWEQGWEEARDVGGAQGYLTVTLTEWPPAGLGTAASGTGVDTPTGTGLGRDRAVNGHTKKRETERTKNPSDSLSESKADSDLFARFRGLWNRESEVFNVRQLRGGRSPETRKRVATFLRDCNADWGLLEASVRAFVRRDFHHDRDVANRLGADTFLRTGHRDDYVERGREFLAGGRTAEDGEQRRARAAADLGCRPEQLTFDAATGEYRKPTSKEDETR